MFDYFSAKNCIERLGRQWDVCDIANVFDWINILHQTALILAKILGFVTAMSEVWTIFAGTSTCVENPTMFWQNCGLFFDPGITCVGLKIPAEVPFGCGKSIHI